MQAPHPFGPAKDSPIRVLLVSSCAEDEIDLANVLASPGWKLVRVESIEEAMQQLASSRVAAVLYDCDGTEGNWRHLLDRSLVCDFPPALVVYSRLADASLWAEVLNMGGYDVLNKPFDPEEVLRVASGACLHFARPAARADGAIPA